VGRHTGCEDLDADRWGAGGRQVGPGRRLGVDVPDHRSSLPSPQADFADDPDELEDPDDPDELDPAVEELEPELLAESDELFVSVLVLVDSLEPFDSPEPDSADAEAFSEFAPEPLRASLR
jgi:hypothetical protein